MTMSLDPYHACNVMENTLNMQNILVVAPLKKQVAGTFSVFTDITMASGDASYLIVVASVLPAPRPPWDTAPDRDRSEPAGESCRRIH
jgi:hypothetical protein